MSAAYSSRNQALALLGTPYVFTQDDLLTTDDFIRRARERGHHVSLDELESLHNKGLLVPLYRLSDTAVEGRRIAVKHDGSPNPRGWVFEAAASGRLRDAAHEGYSAAWPYNRPQDEDPRRWWNGFIYSSWQLLHIANALAEHQFLKHGLDHLIGRPRRIRQRQLVVALAALSTRYLPGVLGRLSMPVGLDEADLLKSRADLSVQELLTISGMDVAQLRQEADALLGDTHHDPIVKWLPLVRYASYRAWSKFQGQPLDCMWKRVAAEVLLRAYEDLATDGLAEPLPDLAGATWHVPQHDRLTPRYPEAQTLERALAELGLSPHPKVILLVEGKTELNHIPRLLAEFAIDQPQDVRVQQTTSSKINAHLIARYGVTPRVGRKVGDSWLLDASPTALVIAMDAENDFETQAKRDAVRHNLQEAIREEVRYQDADISQDELDYLVHIHVWGDDKYELANFGDDELVPAITTLATRQGNPLVGTATWEPDLRAQLQAARLAHSDIKVPLGRIRVKERKVELADLLWPGLLARCEAEYVSGSISTPVLKLVLEVRELVAKLTGVFALSGP